MAIPKLIRTLCRRETKGDDEKRTLSHYAAYFSLFGSIIDTKCINKISSMPQWKPCDFKSRLKRAIRMKWKFVAKSTGTFVMLNQWN